MRVKRPAIPITEKDPPASWAASQTGPREQNEDDYGRADQDTHDYEWVRRGCLYLLADGMGGLDAGKEAAQTAVRQVIQEYTNSNGKSQDVTENLIHAMQVANQHLYRAGTRSGKRMGSTMVACVLKDGKATIAHVGDSRAYHLENGRLRRLTRDHLYATEVQGIKDDDEAKRSPEGNKITRALGKGPELEVDINKAEYIVDDRFLLCSDGISEVLSSQEIGECLSQKTPEEAVRALCFVAEGRLNDNATAVVVFASGKKIRRQKTLKRVVNYAAAAVLLLAIAGGGYVGGRLLYKPQTQTTGKTGEDKVGQSQPFGKTSASLTDDRTDRQPVQQEKKTPVEKPAPFHKDRKSGKQDQDTAKASQTNQDGKVDKSNPSLANKDAGAMATSAGQMVQGAANGQSTNDSGKVSSAGNNTPTPAKQDSPSPTPAGQVIQHPSDPLKIINKTDRKISLWSSRGGKYLTEVAPGGTWHLPSPAKQICWHYTDQIVEAEKMSCPAIGDSGLEISESK